MKLRVEIDSEELLKYTTAREDSELAEELIGNAKDEVIIEEVFNRQLVSDVLDRMNMRELEEMLAEYGFYLDLMRKE